MTLRCNEIFLSPRLQIVILERPWMQWMLGSAWLAWRNHTQQNGGLDRRRSQLRGTPSLKSVPANACAATGTLGERTRTGAAVN